MTRADRRCVIKVVFSFFFVFATGPEDEGDDEDDHDEEDDNDDTGGGGDDIGGDDDGDNDDGGGDDVDAAEYLALWVEEQDTEEASWSHCAPGFCFQIFLSILDRQNFLICREILGNFDYQTQADTLSERLRPPDTM